MNLCKWVGFDFRLTAATAPRTSLPSVLTMGANAVMPTAPAVYVNVRSERGVDYSDATAVSQVVIDGMAE